MLVLRLLSTLPLGIVALPTTPPIVLLPLIAPLALAVNIRLGRSLALIIIAPLILSLPLFKLTLLICTLTFLDLGLSPAVLFVSLALLIAA